MTKSVIFEDYTILETLKKGVETTVYKVRHKDGHTCILRVYNAKISGGKDGTDYKNIVAGCEILFRLGGRHHTLATRKVGLKDNQAFVEMDYVEGEDIRGYLKGQDYFVDKNEILGLVQHISEALAYCHVGIWQRGDYGEVGLNIKESERNSLIRQYGVIHTDIHAGNIIRKRENGEYVLVDFESAIVGRNASDRGRGVPEYVAPERWHQDCEITTESDIYSFGVVIFEFMTGRTPFVIENQRTRQSINKFIGSVRDGLLEVPSIYGLRKEIFEKKYPECIYQKDYPDWLEEMILRCLDHNPKKRFRNGEELSQFVKNQMQDGANLGSNGSRIDDAYQRDCNAHVKACGESQGSGVNDKGQSSNGETKNISKKMGKSNIKDNKKIEEAIKKIKRKDRMIILMIVGVVLIISFLSLCLYNQFSVDKEPYIENLRSVIMDKDGPVVTVPPSSRDIRTTSAKRINQRRVEIEKEREKLPIYQDKIVAGGAVSIDLVYVEGGTYAMGNTFERNGNKDEYPIHINSMSDFYISRYEITQDIWNIVMDENWGNCKKQGDYPVVNISYIEMRKFIVRLNEMTGEHFMLPSEAQWEYAARGGCKSSDYMYSGSNCLDHVGWYKQNCDGVQPVGQKKPNELGLYDMCGNAREMCGDLYGPYEEWRMQVDPIGAWSGKYRVVRGGGYDSEMEECSVMSRDRIKPKRRKDDLGFRLVLPIEKK